MKLLRIFCVGLLYCSLFLGLFACRGGYYNAVGASSTKAITEYSLKDAGSGNYVKGVIDEDSKTIAVEMPFNTKLDSLIAKFSQTGVLVKVENKVQESETTINDFTKPLDYVVEAADSTIATYRVDVKVTKNSAKAITEYSLRDAGSGNYVKGVIDEGSKTIAVEMPFNTKLDSLIAKFSQTGKSVKIGEAEQYSETTKNNFTKQQKYIVYAADNSFATYTVSVKKAELFTCLRDNVTTNPCDCMIENNSKRVWYYTNGAKGAWSEWCYSNECPNKWAYPGDKLKDFNNNNHCNFTDWHLPSTKRYLGEGESIENVGGNWGDLGILAISNGWQRGEKLYDWLHNTAHFFKLTHVEDHPYLSRYPKDDDIDFVMAIDLSKGVVQKNISYENKSQVLLVRDGS